VDVWHIPLKADGSVNLAPAQDEISLLTHLPAMLVAQTWEKKHLTAELVEAVEEKDVTETVPNGWRMKELAELANTGNTKSVINDLEAQAVDSVETLSAAHEAKRVKYGTSATNRQVLKEYPGSPAKSKEDFDKKQNYILKLNCLPVEQADALKKFRSNMERLVLVGGQHNYLPLTYPVTEQESDKRKLKRGRGADSYKTKAKDDDKGKEETEKLKKEIASLKKGKGAPAPQNAGEIKQLKKDLDESRVAHDALLRANKQMHAEMATAAAERASAEFKTQLDDLKAQHETDKKFNEKVHELKIAEGRIRELEASVAMIKEMYMGKISPETTAGTPKAPLSSSQGTGSGQVNT
jgi:hypothetical protein